MMSYELINKALMCPTVYLGFYFNLNVDLTALTFLIDFHDVTVLVFVLQSHGLGLNTII